VSSNGKHKDESQGIGLYTREQEKNTTPFQYFGQVVGGGVVFLCGVLLLVAIFDHRSRETAQFGSPESHLYGFVVAGAVIALGIFMAHAGVIFWGRRVRRHLKKRRQ
jgi:ABC-type Fe3+ transport system permease subunit